MPHGKVTGHRWAGSIITAFWLVQLVRQLLKTHSEIADSLRHPSDYFKHEAVQRSWLIVPVCVCIYVVYYRSHFGLAIHSVAAFPLPFRYMLAYIFDAQPMANAYVLHCSVSRPSAISSFVIDTQKLNCLTTRLTTTS